MHASPNPMSLSRLYMRHNLLTGPPVGNLRSCSAALSHIECIICLMMYVAALCLIIVGVLSTGAFNTLRRLMPDGVEGALWLGCTSCSGGGSTSCSGGGSTPSTWFYTVQYRKIFPLSCHTTSFPASFFDDNQPTRNKLCGCVATCCLVMLYHHYMPFNVN